MVRELSPDEVAQRLRSDPAEVVLLDVRESYERALAAIAPSLHIPMQEVPDRLADLPRTRPLVVYCHTGSRSLMVALYLEGKGFRAVSNLTGGIDAWSRKVDPSVPRYA